MRTEATFVLPQHTTKGEVPKPQLRLLLSHFNIQHDVEELKGATKEMEPFSLAPDRRFRNTNIGVHERKH